MDILFISPSAGSNYQSLKSKYSCIEPPTWALLLAESCRSIGHSVGLIDANAENLTQVQVLDKIYEYNPRLICFVVYGQNVNAGTANMAGAVELSSFLRGKVNAPVCYIGSYIQALPKNV